ncbi:MAG: permease [Breznakibacter sp.]
MNIFFSFLIDYTTEIWHLLQDMSPYLLLGFLFAGILKVIFPQQIINRYMGSHNKFSPVNAALIGVPLPLCSCGVIPTGISFYKNGAGKGSSVSFLISTPQTGIDSMLVTYSLLGLPFALIRVVVAFVTGIVGGYLTDLVNKNGQHESAHQSVQTQSLKLTLSQKIRTIFRYGFHEFLMDIAKWLIIGIAIAGLLAIVIPDDFFSAYIGNEWLSMLVILAASVPLYICATASVPIAAVLMLKGLSPGAALVFLMAGPATNAATIAVVRNVLGNKTFWTYLLSIIGGAFLFGTIINRLLPPEWFSLGEHTLHHAHEHHLLPMWFKSVSALTMIALIVYGFSRKTFFRRKVKPTTHNSNTTKSVLMNQPRIASLAFKPQFTKATIVHTNTLRVEGMTCSHCKASVESHVGKIKGVQMVEASPGDKSVRIEGINYDIQQIKETITGLGYQVNE